ncbi:nucleotide exchange factor GrpE [Arenimonas sp.]|jgi:molecular chaperone GrpE|uniref:nucleotide exchange factor GrpE n=1 Tax=Arenimonas sp. TaxID=1872635 RepID=UPI0037BE2E79
MHTNDPVPESPETPDSPETPEIDAQQQLLADFEQLKAAVAQMQEERLRERAELDNQRKRLARDVDMARKFANERLLGDLLPVFDSLDAGLSTAGSHDSPLREGLDLTYKQLLKVAADNGLQLIDPVGQPFNPDQHQAISRQDGSDAAPDTVVQVFQKGYLLNERLLRPALVVVAGA